MDKQKGYCVKCKEKVPFKNAEEMIMKNGRPAIKGRCFRCGTEMYKILPKKINFEI